MKTTGATPLRIGVIGGGPAGSLFAMCALRYAALADRAVQVTIYEAKDFRQVGRSGCNMCAGIIPANDLNRLAELGIDLPPAMIRSRVSAYKLHTPACALKSTQPDAQAEIASVYRGAGPSRGQGADQVGFDELLLGKAVARGARLQRFAVEEIHRSRPVEVLGGGQAEECDLVVLAAGVNAETLRLQGFDYRPPPTGLMCQTELHLGQGEVESRLASSVHIFLPPDEIAAYGMLIPKGPFVTVSLMGPRNRMRSLREFLGLKEVSALVGSGAETVCGCLPRISTGLARGVCDDGFVAIGDASATRLYKNGLGSALATAERAAWTAIYRGCTKRDFAASYLPLLRGIDRDNQFGRVMFLAVPLLKHLKVVARAYCQLGTEARQHRRASEIHARILWGMFTGAYSYRSLFRMATSPALIAQLLLALPRSVRDVPSSRPGTADPSWRP